MCTGRETTRSWAMTGPGVHTTTTAAAHSNSSQLCHQQQQQQQRQSRALGYRVGCYGGVRTGIAFQCGCHRLMLQLLLLTLLWGMRHSTVPQQMLRRCCSSRMERHNHTQLLPQQCTGGYCLLAACGALLLTLHNHHHSSSSSRLRPSRRVQVAAGVNVVPLPLLSCSTTCTVCRTMTPCGSATPTPTPCGWVTLARTTCQPASTCQHRPRCAGRVRVRGGVRLRIYFWPWTFLSPPSNHVASCAGSVVKA